MINAKQKFLIIFIMSGYFVRPVQTTPLEPCMKWNASSKRVIFGQTNNTVNDDDYSLNLSNSSLAIIRQTGEIAVLDDNNHRVLIFNQSNTTTLFAILSNSSNSTNQSTIHYSPSAITYDINNSIWLFDSWTREIVKMKYPLQYGENATWFNNYINSSGSILFNGTALGLSVDNTSSNAFLSDYDNNQVIYYNESAGIQRAYTNITNGTQIYKLNHPTSIAMNNNGTLFVNDFGNNRIQMFQPNSTNGTTLPTNISGCIGLSLYPPNILVMNTKTAVYLFNLTNNQTTCAIGCDTFELNDTHNAIIDDQQNLIVTDLNQIISYSLDDKCLNITYGSTTTESTTIRTTRTTESTTIRTTRTTESTTTTTTESTTTTNGSTTTKTIPPAFSPVNNCPNGTFGINCSHSNKICDLSQPCFNSGTCINNQTIENGYSCKCPSGVQGNNCEDDQRPCKPYTCLQRGTCIPTANLSFECQCNASYEGKNCEKMINLCSNVTCQKHGVCFPQYLNYTCNCLLGFHGRYCEITETSARVRSYVTKSFGYIAVLMLSFVIGFIILMDVLKYVFHIDPVKSNRNSLQKQKMKNVKKKKQIQQPKVIQHFQYVN